MKKVLSCIFLFLGSLPLLSQDEALTKLKELGKYADVHVQHIVAERDGFIYTVGTNQRHPAMPEKHKVIYIKRFSSLSFMLDKEWEIENDDLDGTSISLSKYVVNDEGINLLIETFDRWKNSQELFSKCFSFDGKLKSVKKLLSVPSSGYIPRELIYKFSPDSTKIMIYVDVNRGTEGENRPIIFVFDNTLKLQYQQAPSFSARKNQLLKPVDMVVSNLGEVFILAYEGQHIEMYNTGFISASYTISRTFKNDSARFCGLEKFDVTFHAATINFNPSGHLIFEGLYSKEQKERFEENLFLTLDHSDLSTIEETKSIIESSFVDQLKPSKTGFMTTSFYFYTFKDVIYQPDGITMIAEQYHQTGNERKGETIKITETAILLIQLEVDGSFKSLTTIERNIAPDSFRSSYILLKNEGQPQLIYYENEENFELRKAGEPVKNAFKGKGAYSLVQVTLNKNGTLTYREILNKSSMKKKPMYYFKSAYINKHGKVFGTLWSGQSVYLSELTLD